MTGLKESAGLGRIVSRCVSVLVRPGGVRHVLIRPDYPEHITGRIAAQKGLHPSRNPSIMAPPAIMATPAEP